MDADTHGVFRSLGGRLAAVPLSAVTIGGSALAFAFNLGFFTAVGTSFLSLFTVQEHLVFALSGAFIVLLVFGVLSTLFNAIESMQTAPLWTVPWLINAAGFVFLFDSIVVVQVLSQYRSYGAQEAILLFVIIALASLTVGILVSGRGDAAQKSYFVIFAISATAFLSGLLYGNQQLHGEPSGYRGHAILKSDHKEYGLVRAGQLYTLIVSPDQIVHAVKTDDLVELSWGIRSKPDPTEP
jgi:hypothetical protein